MPLNHSTKNTPKPQRNRLKPKLHSPQTAGRMLLLAVGALDALRNLKNTKSQFVTARLQSVAIQVLLLLGPLQTRICMYHCEKWPLLCTRLQIFVTCKYSSQYLLGIRLGYTLIPWLHNFLQWIFDTPGFKSFSVQIFDAIFHDH